MKGRECTVLKGVREGGEGGEGGENQLREGGGLELLQLGFGFSATLYLLVRGAALPTI